MLALKKIMLGFVLILSFGLQACSSPIAVHDDVVLSGNNYKIVKARVKGEDRGFKFLGVIGSRASLNDARDNLHESSKITFDGRSLAWANQTAEDFGIYLILFSYSSVTVTADLVEFVDPTATPAKETKPSVSKPAAGKDSPSPSSAPPIL